MTRSEIISTFRVKNPKITTRVIDDSELHVECKQGDKEVCAATRCIVDQDGTAIPTVQNDQSWDLTAKITKFYDIDNFSGSGVLYNGKRLDNKSMAQLDEDNSNWRNNAAGTPKAYYRRGKYLYLDRKIGSAADDIKVYSVLVSDDFDDDNKKPFNELKYLEPFHYSLVLYLKKQAMAQVGNRQDKDNAEAEFNAYISWMAKVLISGRNTAIIFRPTLNRYNPST